MRGLSHNQSILIGIKYENCRRTLDVYLLVAISIGQIQSKPIYIKQFWLNLSYPNT